MEVAIKTHEDWTEWVDKPRKEYQQPLSKEQYYKLHVDDRDAHDAQRIQFNNQWNYIDTEASKRIMNEIKLTLLINQDAPPVARHGIVLDGQPVAGKSSLLVHMGRRYQRGLRKKHPEKFERADFTYAPVVYLTLPSVVTQKSFAENACAYFGLPVATRDSAMQLISRFEFALDDAQTSLVMIDDLHYMDLSRREGQEINNLLKYLANRTPATFIYAGVELEDTALFSEGRPNSRKSNTAKIRQTQTSGRFTVHELKPFGLENAQEWKGVIATLENGFVLYDHEYGSLSRDHWQYLHERTHGSIGALSYLLKKAAILAIQHRTEAITRPLLDSVKIGKAYPWDVKEFSPPSPSEPDIDPVEGIADSA